MEAATTDQNALTTAILSYKNSDGVDHDWGVHAIYGDASDDADQGGSAFLARLANDVTVGKFPDDLTAARIHGAWQHVLTSHPECHVYDFEGAPQRSGRSYMSPTPNNPRLTIEISIEDLSDTKHYIDPNGPNVTSNPADWPHQARYRIMIMGMLSRFFATVQGPPWGSKQMTFAQVPGHVKVVALAYWHYAICSHALLLRDRDAATLPRGSEETRHLIAVWFDGQRWRRIRGMDVHHGTVANLNNLIVPQSILFMDRTPNCLAVAMLEVDLSNFHPHLGHHDIYFRFPRNDHGWLNSLTQRERQWVTRRGYQTGGDCETVGTPIGSCSEVPLPRAMVGAIRKAADHFGVPVDVNAMALLRMSEEDRRALYDDR